MARFFKFRSRCVQTSALVIACAFLSSNGVHAAPISLSVDSTLSSVTYDSSIDLSSTPYAATPDSADLAGSILVDVDVSAGGVISGLSLTGGDATATSNLTQEYVVGFLGTAGFNVFDLSLGFGTPGVPPGPNPSVAGGSFSLANHSVAFDDAMVGPTGSGSFGALLFVENFPEDPMTLSFLPTANFGGSGMITAAPLGGLDYLLTLTIPFAEQNTEDLSISFGLSPGQLIFNRDISGTLVATGIITVLEPSARLLIAIVGIGLAV